MSDSINSGGPAFPFQHIASPNSDVCYGITIRDYLASKETLLDADHPDSASLPLDVAEKLAGRPMPAPRSYEWLGWNADWRAALKYLRADAMIAAREKGAQ